MNAVSESGSKEPPPEFCGGVIADPMGLGKTLTVIALAATGLTTSSSDDMLTDQVFRDELNAIPTTLVIVPPPREFTSHI